MSGLLISDLPVVMFRCGGHYFAFEAQYVRQQGQFDPQNHFALPNAAALLTDDLIDAHQPMQWLVLQGASGELWQLSLPSRAELVVLSAECIHALPALLQRRREIPALQALAHYQDELVALLNVDQLQAMSLLK